jgi:hypothetical protein
MPAMERDFQGTAEQLSFAQHRLQKVRLWERLKPLLRAYPRRRPARENFYLYEAGDNVRGGTT